MKLIRPITMMPMLFLFGTGLALAYQNTVTYSGQGLTTDGFGGYDLNQELCGVANGADVAGPYILWVLTASKATHADITGPWGTAAMIASGNGTYKYVSGWYEPSTLPGNVIATYDGIAKNAQLTISHGCRPKGTGWCSPGFWKNATAGAWALTGHSPSDLFNVTVYDYWYGASFAVNPTLQVVLNNPPIYSGSPQAGTSGYALNAFNATGAMLTDALKAALPDFGGFSFDALANDHSDTCPIDHFGNVK
jgi:hypothetical protein